MWSWVGLAIGLLAAGYGVRRLALGYPDPGRRLRRLSRGEAALLDAAAEAMYPPGGEIECSGREADLAGYIDRLLDVSHPRIRLLMHLLFHFVEHATLIFPAPGRGGRRRYSSLSPEQQTRALADWASGRWFFGRLVFTSLRALLTLGYFAHPPVLRQLRLAPLAIETPVCEVDLLFPPIGRGPEAIRLGRADLTPPSDGTPLDPDGPVDRRYAVERS
jgi:hypothetical protein